MMTNSTLFLIWMLIIFFAEPSFGTVDPAHGKVSVTRSAEDMNPAALAVAPETMYNLAKFQTSSADSANSSTPVQYGNDGFVTQENRWVSDSSGPHWYEVELAVPMEIGSAHLYSGATSSAAIADFCLQYHDGSVWVDIAGTSIFGNTLPVLNLEFSAPVVAQQFRLYTTDGTARIKELALYAPTTDGSSVPFGTDLDLNIAKQRQFVCSSIGGANFPGLAIDGYVDDSSAWASTDTAGPHTFDVHFPQSELIRGVHLYSGFEGISGTQMEDFTVDYWDGSAWITFSGGSVTGNTEENLILWFDAAVAATKVRVQTTDSKQAVIRELVVFAENGRAAYPLWTDALDEAPPSQSFLDYEDSYYSLENRSTGLNLSSSTNGSFTTSAEPWFQVLLNIGTDTYRLRSKDRAACFEVALASTNEGAVIIEGEYASMPHQRWRLENSADGMYFQIINVWSGLVLGLDGTNVVQQASGAEFSKQWKINYKTHYPKKGQASFAHFNFMYESSWNYNWGYTGESDYDYGQYMPMQWGGMASSSAGILRQQPIWYSRANQTTVLGFNEPDKESPQSNIEEEIAAYQWPRFERMNLPLVGPCPAQHNGTWRKAYEAIAEEQGFRSEYMALHWYAGCNGGNPQNIIKVINSLYSTYGKPIWITEFAVKDWYATGSWSRNDNYNWLAEFLWRAEGITHLKKYSIFEWGVEDNNADPTVGDGPTMGLHNSNDKNDPGYEDLSECGLLLAGWDGDASVRNNKPYIIHNKGRFLRLMDDPNSNTVTYADVLNRDQMEQFILQTASSGKTYIVGLSSGRLLSYDGSNIGLADAGTTDTRVEWVLNEYQYGWYYIDHPSTGTRLRMTDANMIDAADDSTTGDNLRFRFIVPAMEFEIPDEAVGTVLVGYDFDASSSYPTAPTMLSPSVTASLLTSPMDVATVSSVGDTSGQDATGVGFGSTDMLGCLGIGVDDATTANFSDAVAGDDYITFTVAPGDDRYLKLSSLSFKATKKVATSVDEYAVTDRFGNLIGSAATITNVVGLTGTYDSIVVDLTRTALANITESTEFRIYAWGRGSSSTGGTLATIDKLVLRGTAGPILVGYDFDEGTPDATEIMSPHVTASALTSPMNISFPTTIGDNSGVDAEGLAFGSTGMLGCIGIGVNVAITTSFSEAVAGDDYLTFTVTPDAQVHLDLDAITFKASTTASTSVDEVAVTDASGNLIGSTTLISTLGQTTAYQGVRVDLSGSLFQSLTESTTFRIYAWGRGTTSTGSTLAMIDKVTLYGNVIFNATPSAAAQSVETAKDTPVAITLTGSDPEGGTLGYHVVFPPDNGTLNGTVPDLTYTPTVGYLGMDSFIFTVNDGQTTSTPSVVSILVGVATDVIAGYDFDDGTSNATRVVTVKDVNVTASNYGVGAGLVDLIDNSGNALAEALDAEGYLFGTANPFSYGGATTTFGFTDMNNADNLALAIANEDYMVFTLTPASSYQLDLTRFTFRTRVNSVNNSAERWALFSSVDGFMEGAQISVGQTTVEATYVNNGVNLSATAFQGLTNAVTFRLYIYGGNEPWSAATLFDKVVVHGGVNATFQTAYERWLSRYGLTGDDALMGADVENGGAGDGYDNLAEYALGMDPTISDAGSRDWIDFTSESGTNWFEYVHYRRTNYEEEGLSYLLIDSMNLIGSVATTNAQDQIFVGPAIDGYEPVTNRYKTDDPIKFITFEIRQD